SAARPESLPHRPAARPRRPPFPHTGTHDDRYRDPGARGPRRGRGGLPSHQLPAALVNAVGAGEKGKPAGGAEAPPAGCFRSQAAAPEVAMIALRAQLARGRILLAFLKPIPDNPRQYGTRQSAW